MKVLGAVLLLAGILMMIFTGFSFTKKEKLVDIGPLEVSKTEKKRIGWPVYAGGATALAGLLIIVAGKGKKE